MKVILLKDINDLGKKYEVKEVKNGYARNFLIPNRFVKPATKQNLKWLENQKEIVEKKAQEELKLAQDLASKIDGLEIIISVKVGSEGQLFESINNVKIAEKLMKMGFKIKKSQIELKEPIKSLGEFPIKINLDHNLEAEVRLMVIEEEEKKEEKE